MKTINILRPLLGLAAAASGEASDNSLPTFGPSKPGPGTSPEALVISEAAGRTPNATNSVSFTRTYNNAPETWTWRINITDIAAPNRISDLGSPSANFSQGQHFVNTQWQLQWPGDTQTFQAFLEQRNLTVSFTALVSNKPTNITDKYGTGGDCGPVLGDECTSSIVHAVQNKNPEFASLAGCDSTLDVHIGDGTGISFGKRSDSSNS